MRTIGLFPLNIVLFPGSSYPLHIFEGRYKALVNEAIENKGEFGITLMLAEGGKLYQTGCLARVADILGRYDDGRMDIVAAGTTRFQAAEPRLGEHPYLVADIETFEDNVPLPDRILVHETIRRYNQLIESVFSGAEERLDPADWTEGK